MSLTGGACRLAVIRGSKDGVQLARIQLLKCVEEHAQLETTEIFVSEVLPFLFVGKKQTVVCSSNPS